MFGLVFGVHIFRAIPFVDTTKHHARDRTGEDRILNKQSDTARPRRALRKRGQRKHAISRQSLHMQVADRLRNMIVHGELAQGEKVRVAELSETLGVSLTPLREALKVIAEEGLVELMPNRGARVLPFTVEEADDLFEVIAGLEGLAAELAAERMSSVDLANLEDLHEKMREHHSRSERDEYFDINSMIHKAIIDHSNNAVLIATHEKLMVRAERGRYIAIIDPDRWNQALSEHEAVMEAFRKQDAEQAGRIWRKHLSNTGRAVHDALERQTAGELDPHFKKLTEHAA